MADHTNEAAAEASNDEYVEEGYEQFLSRSGMGHATRRFAIAVALAVVIAIAMMAWWSRTQTISACEDLKVLDQVAPDRVKEAGELSLEDTCKAMRIDNLATGD